LRQKIGTQNREHLRQHFTIEQMVSAYEQLWLSCFAEMNTAHKLG